MMEFAPPPSPGLSFDGKDIGRRPLILVVDDHPMNIQALYEILKGDHEVCMATHGEQALTVAEARSPDLVLLDVMMPGMDGYEVCRRLKRHDPTAHTPVIFVTAQSDPAEEALALDEGAADFISKPFHEKVVKARVRTQLTLKFQADRLRSLAMIDGLTGVANRRAFDGTLARQWAHHLRTGDSLAVIMLDVDRFKQFNDRYGHQAGDACLVAIGAALKITFRRPLDLVARYGGEEFACILPNTSLEGAHHKALELEREIRRLGIPHEASDVASVVTASIGVAAMLPSAASSHALLVTEADRMLYAAKRAGRGRVTSTPRPNPSAAG